MLDALIPIGSVVRLEGQDWLAFVLGFYPDNGEQLFDYLLAPYPMGIVGQGDTLLVNAGDIAEVVSRGYLDEQGEEVLDAAVAMMNAQAEAYVKMGKYLENAGKFGEGSDAFGME